MDLKKKTKSDNLINMAFELKQDKISCEFIKINIGILVSRLFSMSLYFSTVSVYYISFFIVIFFAL